MIKIKFILSSWCLQFYKFNFGSYSNIVSTFHEAPWYDIKLPIMVYLTKLLDNIPYKIAVCTFFMVLKEPISSMARENILDGMRKLSPGTLY